MDTIEEIDMTLQSVRCTLKLTRQSVAQLEATVAQLEYRKAKLEASQNGSVIPRKRRATVAAEADPDHGESDMAVDVAHRWPLQSEEYTRYGRQLIMPEIGLEGWLPCTAWGSA